MYRNPIVSIIVNIVNEIIYDIHHFVVMVGTKTFPNAKKYQ